MQQFIGTKMVSARPMTRAAYNEYRGWQLPADEDGADDGYLVEYMDGGKPNMTGHAGYVSWSPKPQFDAAYLFVGDVSKLQPHQQRAMGERVQLDDNTTKLAAFLNSDTCCSLDAAERERLTLQLDAMRLYSRILGDRIAAFTTN